MSAPASDDRSLRTREGGRAPVPPSESLLRLTPEVTASIRVLIVDDERSLRESCRNLLQYEGYQVTACSRGAEARETLKRDKFDIVLLDLYMREVSGLRLLRTCLDAQPETIVIVMTGKPSLDSSLEVLRAGAWDYLPKPFSASHLQILLGRAAHAVMVARESRVVGAARAQGQSEGVTVLGMAPAFRRVLDLARRVARTDASVFITGDSGSGKELIAQFIHDNSRRSSRPLVAVNCAALPEALLESEMFGHCKGAFTGALRDKPGLLETANGGTLLLDELVEMSKPVQAKLLRVIQDGVVRRVGSEATDAVVNIRFIACTNANPEAAVKAGILREDLYYRLRVVPIHVPPLRDRPEDVELLAEHFLAYYWSRHHGATTPRPKFRDAAVRALRARPWQGNVRELQNIIEHMVVLLEPRSAIGPQHIPELGYQPAGARRGRVAPAVSSSEPFFAARDRVVSEFALQYFEQLVTQVGGSMSEAARVAGVDRATLYRMMKRYGLRSNL